ncbi:MAG: DUF4411 family protein [Bacteroidales bacterium]|nr:DUF4411 family protein [Bacteroidales bacterium]
MIVVIDTCSLVSLARYYLPFDKDKVLYNFIKQKIVRKEVIIIDKVFRESSFVSNKIVMSSLRFLTDKAFTKAAKIPYDTSLLIAPDPAGLIRQIDESFVIPAIKRQKKLKPTEYDSEKTRFLNGADMTQIILCLKMKEAGIPITIVTEETRNNNDGKLFKKIPVICSELDIPTMTLPEYLKMSEGINLTFI